MTETMRHMLVKATVTQAADEGTFTAVISSVSIDRDGDVVEPAAVVTALQAWAPLGKMIPLSWDHEYDADHIIGHIVPGSVKGTDAGEVEADGWIDQSFERGKHAWRLVKSGTLGFSYGYLIKTAEPRGTGKGLHISAMDIFEVTATPIPANGDTRVISYKSLAELKAAMTALEQEEEERGLPEVVEAAEVIEDDVQAQISEAHDALIALEHFEPGEVDGMKRGVLTAVWTSAYLNDLPDEAFLHGREFPYKDTTGAVDVPHLRNALVQIQEASVPTHVKDRLTTRAQRILDNTKAVDVTDQEEGAQDGRGPRAVDPLRKQADDVELEYFSDGLDRSKPPRQVEQPKPAPQLDVKELRQRMFEETLTLLSD
jgi:hypothetical protein